MAAFNASCFIDEALRSVAMQIRLPELVIVVDDGSGDDTADRAARWSRELPVRVLRLDRNVGAGAARAQAMVEVDTDLVCFVDADDVLLPDHLDLLERMWRRRGGVISPRAQIWHPPLLAGDYHRSLGLVVPRRRQLARLMAVNFVFYGALFPKALYDEVDGLRSLRLAEDWDLWVRMAAAGARFHLAPRATVLYRRHDASTTAGSDAVDVARAGLIRQLQRERPQLLSSRQWRAALSYSRAIGHGRRGFAQLRHRHLKAGLVDLARTVTGGWPPLLQVGRQAGYFTVRTLARQPIHLSRRSTRRIPVGTPPGSGAGRAPGSALR